MLAKYKCDVICDLAQYYGIHDYTAYPVRHIAILVCGLPDTSRVMINESQLTVDVQTYLLANIIDGIKVMLWQNGGNKGDKPKMISEKLVKKIENQTFKTSEGFEAYRAQFVKTGE